MKGLFLKDLALLKTQMNSLFIVVAIAVFMLFAGENTAFVITYSVMVFAMFGVTTMSYDHFDNGYAFLFTLPISRKLYILEKYIFSMVSIIIGAAIAGMLMFIADFVKAGTLPTASEFSFVLGYAAGATIFLAIILPIQFKFGPEKSRIAMIAIFMVIMAGIFVLRDMINSDKTAQILIKISEMSPSTIMTGVVGAALLLLLVSYLISGKIMEKKEF